MEQFFKIRAEKQDNIINAAFTVFGRLGYKKASLADIAKEAGITKGMITYYFGSKKNLYLYLAEIAQQTLQKTVEEKITPDVTDFFEKLKILASVQIAAVKENPAPTRFANSVYDETDPEVVDDIERIFKSKIVHTDSFIMEELLEKSDFSKFKPGFDPKLLCRFITWAVDGCSIEMYEKSCKENMLDISAVEEMSEKLYACLDLMQKTFYKEV